VAERIRPALEKGHIVLGDRFIDASMAYQSAGLGMDEAFVRAASDFAARGLRPDRTYLLDIPPEESRRRLLARAKAAMAGEAELDRIEQRPEAYHRRVREKFLHIAAADPQRVLLLDAARPAEELASVILGDCKRFL